nr:MAG TPA: hypothetical protein [Bacteriophage sp.]
MPIKTSNVTALYFLSLKNHRFNTFSHEYLINL